jgi:Ca2+-binding RTX toxin-like protein
VFTFTGGALADVINGGAGADVLTGGSGADTITGGEAGDTYSGGLGKDSIVLTETVAAVDSVRFAEAGATNVDTVTGFAVTGAADVIGFTKGDIDNGGTANTVSTANGTDVGAAVAANAATVAARATGGAGATAAANAVNLLFMAATTVTTFAEAIGTNGFTNAALDADLGATEGVAAVYYDLATQQAVFGYIRNSSTTVANTLNSSDTFVEVVRVGMTVASYTQANITAGFEIF